MMDVSRKNSSTPFNLRSRYPFPLDLVVCLISAKVERKVDGVWSALLSSIG